MESRYVNPDEIYLASFPFGGRAGMKLRPVLLLSGPVGDVPEVARAAMIEAHRDYPVPKNMSLAEAEALLGRCCA